MLAGLSPSGGNAASHGFTCRAILFHTKANERFMSPKMIGYCNSDKLCRRDILFSGGIVEKPCSPCLCCDICRLKCNYCTNSGFSNCLVSYAFSHFLTLIETLYNYIDA